MSKKKWENRIQSVEKKKGDRQKKRQENISKKKKEKKAKVVKQAVKRGRVVIWYFLGNKCFVEIFFSFFFKLPKQY